MPSSEWKKAATALSYRGDTRIDFHVGFDPARSLRALVFNDERRLLTWKS